VANNEMHMQTHNVINRPRQNRASPISESMTTLLFSAGKGINLSTARCRGARLCPQDQSQMNVFEVIAWTSTATNPFLRPMKWCFVRDGHGHLLRGAAFGPHHGTNGTNEAPGLSDWE